MAGDKYYGNADFRRCELGLKIEPSKPRKPDVQDKAADLGWRPAPQKLRRRGKGHAPQADRRKERLHAISDIRIVIHHEDDRIICGSIFGL